MKTSYFVTASAVLLLLAGCRSTSFPPTAGFDFDKFTPAWFSRSQDGRKTAIADSSSPGDRRRNLPKFRPKLNGATSSRPRGQDRSTLDATITANLELGYTAESGQLWDDAKTYYQRVVAEDPGHALAHHRLGVIADKQHEYRTAEEHYLTALRTNPNDASLLSDFGYSFLMQNRYSESEDYLRQALRYDPAHSTAMNNFGLLHARRGNYDQALATFRQTGSESEAQAKIRELFPQGPPANNQFPGGNAGTIAQSPLMLNQSAPVNPFVPGSSFSRPGPTVPRNPFAPTAANPVRLATGDVSAGNGRPDTRDFQQQGPSATVQNPLSGFPSSRNGTATLGGTNPVSYSSSAQSGGMLQNPRQTPYTGGTQIPDSWPGQTNQNTKTVGELGIDPLDTMPTWPPSTAADPLRPAGLSPGASTEAIQEGAFPSLPSQPTGDSGIQLGPQGASTITPNGRGTAVNSAPGSNPSTALPRLENHAIEVARRQAALIGMNAGPDALFPLLPQMTNTAVTNLGTAKSVNRTDALQRQSQPASLPQVLPTASAETTRQPSAAPLSSRGASFQTGPATGFIRAAATFPETRGTRYRGSASSQAAIAPGQVQQPQIRWQTKPVETFRQSFQPQRQPVTQPASATFPTTNPTDPRGYGRGHDSRHANSAGSYTTRQSVQTPNYGSRFAPASNRRTPNYGVAVQPAINPSPPDGFGHNPGPYSPAYAGSAAADPTQYVPSTYGRLQPASNRNTSTLYTPPPYGPPPTGSGVR